MENSLHKIPYNRLDVILESLAILLVLYMTGLILLKFGQLPNTIPTHYNMEGRADAWGSKSSVIVIWVVAVVFYVGLTILNRYPQLFNFPVEITEENKFVQYRLATRLVRGLKLCMLIIFMLIMVSSVRAPSHYKELLLGKYFIIVAMVLTFAPIIYYFILARKAK